MIRLMVVCALVACGAPVSDAPDLAVVVDAAVAPDLVACRLSKPYASSDAVCNGCAETHCCVEVNACYGAASCDNDYVNCYLACGLFANPDAGGSDVPACVADCGARYPAGRALFDAAIGCVSNNCAGCS